MNLSVIIVAYNSSATLARGCRAAARLLPDAELIVVDNASEDDTREIAAQLGVVVVENPTNVGFGRACNRGAANAHGSHLLFMNPDVELTDVDRPVLDRLNSNMPFGLLAPELHGATAGGSLGEHWLRDLLRHGLGPLRPRELPAFTRKRARPADWWPVGAMLLVRKDEFTALGGFDPRYFLYYEDRDLARRYRARGMPASVIDSLRGTHQRGTSSEGQLAGVVVRQAWSLLSWIEYLCVWHGHQTAIRAARTAAWLRAAARGILSLLEHLGPLQQRVSRKRLEFAEVDSFVRWQCSFAPGTAEQDFCPQSRRIMGRR